jgi:hypothetical protein
VPRPVVPETRPVATKKKSEPAAAAAPQPASALPDVHELPGATLEEKVKRLLHLAAGPGEHGALEREVLAILERTVAESRRAKASRAEVLAEIRAIEQRILEQKRLLEASEEDLERLMREKSLEPGVASIYRSVQGLDPSERNFAKKKELLAVLYRTNVELLKQLRDELGRA